MASISYQNKKSLSIPWAVENLRRASSKIALLNPTPRLSSQRQKSLARRLERENHLTRASSFVKESLNSGKERIPFVLQETRELVDPIIQELLMLGVEKDFKEPLKYQVSVGGKRIRPALTILSCRLLGGKVEDVLYPAAGLEILHNYSLIIDDIIDNSRLRRGHPTCWRKFGKGVAECLAIEYLAAAFEAAQRSIQPAEISKLFVETIKKAAFGQFLDLTLEQKRNPEPFIESNKDRYHNPKRINRDIYLNMVRKKTGIPIQTCCKVGAICAKAQPEAIERLGDYGLNVGVAGQIKDDILDIFGKKEKFGKEIGQDIKSGKLGNIVIIFALQELKNKSRQFLLEIINKRKLCNKEIKKAISLIGKTKAYQKSYKLGRGFVEKAKRSLQSLPQNEWNEVLSSLADFFLEREK